MQKDRKRKGVLEHGRGRRHPSRSSTNSEGHAGVLRGCETIRRAAWRAAPRQEARNGAVARARGWSPQDGNTHTLPPPASSTHPPTMPTRAPVPSERGRTQTSRK